METFEIGIKRTVYYGCTYRVEANSCKEAEEKAIKLASNDSLDYMLMSEYEIDYAEQIEE